MQYPFILTHQLNALPGNLDSLLTDNSIKVVGVNIGGDLARIGRDFGIERAMSRRNKDTFISLGTFARKIDVV